MPNETKSGESLHAAAIRLYVDDSDGDIEIDAVAQISEADEGTWVAAWVYVRKEEFNA